MRVSDVDQQMFGGGEAPPFRPAPETAAHSPRCAPRSASRAPSGGAASISTPTGPRSRRGPRRSRPIRATTRSSPWRRGSRRGWPCSCARCSRRASAGRSPRRWSSAWRSVPNEPSPACSSRPCRASAGSRPPGRRSTCGGWAGWSREAHRSAPRSTAGVDGLERRLRERRSRLRDRRLRRPLRRGPGPARPPGPERGRARVGDLGDQPGPGAGDRRTAAPVARVGRPRGRGSTSRQRARRGAPAPASVRGAPAPPGRVPPPRARRPRHRRPRAGQGHDRDRDLRAAGARCVRPPIVSCAPVISPTGRSSSWRPSTSSHGSSPIPHPSRPPWRIGERGTRTSTPARRRSRSSRSSPTRRRGPVVPTVSPEPGAARSWASGCPPAWAAAGLASSPTRRPPRHRTGRDPRRAAHRSCVDPAVPRRRRGRRRRGRVPEPRRDRRSGARHPRGGERGRRLEAPRRRRRGRGRR